MLLRFFLLIARYTYLQVFQSVQSNNASNKSWICLQAIPPEHGYIYDWNGIFLADNYPVFAAVINRTDIENYW